MWHVSLEPRSLLSKAVWVKACWRLIQGKRTKAARDQTVRLSDMRGLSPRSPQEIQAMLSTLEPWHRRDLGMAFQQPTNRPLGQLSVKRSQSLMPKDTDGDNELDPIDFYTCTLDLNHWKDWWREGIFGVTSMQQDFVLEVFWGLVNGMRIRMEEEDRLQRQQADSMRLVGWLWEGENWERMGNWQDISVTWAEFQVEHFNLRNWYTSFKIHSRMKGRAFGERQKSSAICKQVDPFLKTRILHFRESVVESMGICAKFYLWGYGCLATLKEKLR